VDLRVGSSGFSYDFWKGTFYPDEIDGDQMLAFYAAHFRTVEINNTFYRMPKADVLRRWHDAVPSDFRFAIKASRRITHESRLKETNDNVAYLFRQLEALGDKLGCVLFQLPGNLRKDIGRLTAFFATLPTGSSVVMELRHASWFDDETYDVLATHGIALGANDEDRPDPPLQATAPFGYLRLRDERYEESVLVAWLERLEAVWPAAYVFFKHEETAPFAIEQLDALIAARRAAPAPSPTDPNP
jgi:uncharacterized protein YecE (DUF72 family)